MTGFMTVFDLYITEFSPCFTEFSPWFTEFRTCFTEFRTHIDPFLDLPHASYLSDLPDPVSVIIRCKTVKNHVVENTALSPDEERDPGAACCGSRGGIWTPTSRDILGCAHCRHFAALTLKSRVWSNMAH